MTLTMADYVIHTERNNAHAKVVFKGVLMAKCIDMGEFLCKWHTPEGATLDQIETLATDHVGRAGHVVAVIDNGAVTTLMPKEGTPETP